MTKAYLAMLCTADAARSVLKDGIEAPGKDEATLLSLDLNGAIGSALLDIREDKAKRDYFKQTGKLYVVTFDIPDNAVVSSFTARVPELKKYTFFGYAKAIPPEWVIDCQEVDLSKEADQ